MFMQYIKDFLEKIFLAYAKATFLFEDNFGNKYFTLKTKDSMGRNIRYVSFHKEANASTLPVGYSAWLRYSAVSPQECKAESDRIKVRKINPIGEENIYFLPKKRVIYNSWKPYERE